MKNKIKSGIKKVFKGVNKIMKEALILTREILMSSKSRAVSGLILMGLGTGLLASAYIPLPAE